MSAFGSTTVTRGDASMNSSTFNNNNELFGDSRRNRKKPFKMNGTAGGFSNPSATQTGASPDKAKLPRGKNLLKRFNQGKERSESPSVSTRPTTSSGKVQVFDDDDVHATGPLFTDPAFFGFTNQKPQTSTRPVPKYFLTQPKLLHTPEFIQNQWDKENQEKMTGMEVENQGRDYQGLYEDFQKLRDTERAKMEELGLVDAENSAKDLTEAITFQGSCLDMCPVFERVRRQLENNVKALEKDPVTNKISRERAVKAFSRPAAGQPPPLPSDVRPPFVLKQTLDYLVDNIVLQLPDAHSFVWDRTRSIRQDFTYQNSFGPEAVDCNERIVRIHLLSLHIMAGGDVEYSQQQELEQFNKALQTLMEIYQDVRTNGGKSPNEAEFRAYHLLSHVRDPDLERQIQNLPNSIYQDPKVQLALRFRNIMTQNNVVERGVTNLVGALNSYSEFFRLVYSDETPLLMACLLETHFNEVRFYALKAMSRSYHTKTKPYPLARLQEVLGYDSPEKLIKFLSYYEIDTLNVNGEVFVDLFNKEKLEKQYKLNSFLEKAKYSPPYSTQLDKKYNGQDLKSFVNSGLPNRLIKFDTQPIVIKPKSAPVAFQPPKILTSIPFQAPSAPPILPPASTTKPGLFKPLESTNDGIKPNAFQFTPTPAQPNNNGLFQDKGKTEPPTKPTFQFTPNEAPPNDLFKLAPKPNEAPPVDKTKPKIDFGFTKSAAFDTAAPKIHSSVNPPLAQEPLKPILKMDQKMTPTPTQPPVATIAPAAAPQKKKLTDEPKFPQALGQVYQDILKSTLDSELQLILSRILHDFLAANERKRVVKLLGEELYEAFFTDIVYELTYEAKAYQFYVQNLKKRCIRSIIRNSKKAMKKFKEKRTKMEELRSISLNKKKKRRESVSSIDSNASSVLLKRRRHNESLADVSLISAKQHEVHELWTPIDVKKFIDVCSNDLHLKINEENLDLKFVLIVENWKSLYSKWLNSKLGLKANMRLLVYENFVQNEKIDLSITSLPGNNYLNKDFFSKTAFVLFECGLTLPNELSIEDKLKKDERSLNKIISLVDKYSYYKVLIIVTFWDVSESGISSQEVAQHLNLGQCTGVANLQNLILCDMTVKHGNINNILSQAFIKVGQDFTGGLTSRGIKRQVKQDSLKKQQLQMVPAAKTPQNEKIDKLETKMLDKAKSLRKYEYLNNHVNTTSSKAYQYRRSACGSTTLNKSSVLNYLAQKNLHANTSNNSTFLSSSIMTNNNDSILQGFGNGVIEESTPSTSPKGKKRKADGGSSSLSQLQELTASIKKRYKK
ncbi:Nuclear mRNA export protein SAC3 [Candida viswanathii]|uniref:Nuclear mRNA export factor n=1 Tax=Candida viswanathii TaxID=5486 RepID=A0A367XQX6_9ASCO|nr:Nuclear mRNA export protein SAC3 [Candida viswanathii]